MLVTKRNGIKIRTNKGMTSLCHNAFEVEINGDVFVFEELF